MRIHHPLRIVLSESGSGDAKQLEMFRLVNLGLIQSLASGALSATEAVERFYHADNCLYVRKHFRNRSADAIMSHGVQLPDLFETLPAEAAQKEFYRELETMRALCSKLIARKPSKSAGHRATA